MGGMLVMASDNPHTFKAWAGHDSTVVLRGHLPNGSMRVRGRAAPRAFLAPALADPWRTPLSLRRQIGSLAQGRHHADHYWLKPNNDRSAFRLSRELSWRSELSGRHATEPAGGCAFPNHGLARRDRTVTARRWRRRRERDAPSLSARAVGNGNSLPARSRGITSRMKPWYAIFLHHPCHRVRAKTRGAGCPSAPLSRPKEDGEPRHEVLCTPSGLASQIKPPRNCCVHGAGAPTVASVMAGQHFRYLISGLGLAASVQRRVVSADSKWQTRDPASFCRTTRCLQHEPDQGAGSEDGWCPSSSGRADRCCG